MKVNYQILNAMQESIDYIPAEQLIIAFVGVYRGEPIFLELTPKKKKGKKK